jgi:hypothetical protein
MLKAGDLVRLAHLPENLPSGDDKLPTRSTFEKCLGQVFPISGFNDIGWAELNLEALTGNIGESVWVEPEYLEAVSR